MLDTSRRVRDGGHPVQVDNSGLEVWLYDEANLDAIRRDADNGCGGMPGNFEALARDGLVVGYGLIQDDAVDAEVHVGAPFTRDELSISRWLEPQNAFLRLPSGRLCIESNDASRIGPQTPMEEGARITVPAGEYHLTIYRIDHEALDREGLEWDGPQELILLTPGGTKQDAATDILPFEPRRDLGWVGRYTIKGNRADALVWLGDYWDTFTLNLDAPAAEKLGLKAGSYLRTHVPDAGLTLISVFAESWEKARKLPHPDGIAIDEYGYASFVGMSDWDGAQALFCRRDSAKKKAEDRYQTQWLSCVVEVLDVQPMPVVAAGEGMTKTELRTKQIFDPGFLGLILSDVLPELADRDEVSIADALDVLDTKFGKAGLHALGDVAWEQRAGVDTMEMGARLYAGLPDTFAAAFVNEGFFEILLVSERKSGDWVATGLADDLERFMSSKDDRGLPVPNPRVKLQSMDEALAKIISAHKSALKKAKDIAAAPAGFEATVAAFQRFLAVAFG
jgi:hypothetical protein